MNSFEKIYIWADEMKPWLLMAFATLVLSLTIAYLIRGGFN